MNESQQIEVKNIVGTRRNMYYLKQLTLKYLCEQQYKEINNVFLDSDAGGCLVLVTRNSGDGQLKFEMN